VAEAKDTDWWDSLHTIMFPGKAQRILNLETVNKTYLDQFNKCSEERKKLRLSLQNEKRRADGLEKLAEKLEGELSELKPEPSEAEKYWNNRHPEQTIFYRGRYMPGYNKQLNVDVRIFFTPGDSILSDLVEQHAFNSGSLDSRAFRIEQFVQKQITYKTDKSALGIVEYWQLPFETWAMKAGDCEDGAILMANLMVLSGIPVWRVRLNAGDVKGGGHAYITYCRELDNEFIVLDWCYWPKHTELDKRKLHKEEANYYGIWFSWTKDKAYGRMETMANMPEDFEVSV